MKFFHGIDFIAAIAISALGGMAAYLLMLVFCSPAAVIAETGFAPLKDNKWANKFWEALKKCHTFKNKSSKFRDFLSWALSLLPYRFQYLLQETGEEDSKKKVIDPNHYFAVTNALLFLLLFFAFSLFASPTAVNSPIPSSAYVFVLFILLIWFFAFMHFHLVKYKISPVFVLLIFIIVGYSTFNVDHYFNIVATKKSDIDKLTPIASDIDEFTPIAVVKKGEEASKNLVVITTTGGGILASGWTTLALKNLIGKRPELKNEIRLISGVSGGSVGTAFYIDALLRYPNGIDQNKLHDDCKREGNDEKKLLCQVHKNATKSALSTTAYGIAFYDFWRLISSGTLQQILNFVSCGSLHKTFRDRGTLLEEKWANIAAGIEVDRKVHYQLRELNKHISKGLIPSVIFGATVMENGSRVMVSPINFTPIKNKGKPERAETLLSEYLQLKNEQDISLWTAARLSATFSYVTPAARMEGPKNEDEETKNSKFRKHHIIDGGYYDNYGVASALDWLQPVMEERIKENSKLKFKRLLIIELRSSPQVKLKEMKPASGWKAALLGPMIGLGQIRDTAANERNDIDLTRWIKSWEARFKGRSGGDSVIFKKVLFQAQKAGPLSWHLTKRQIETQEKEWEPSKIAGQKTKIQQEMDNMFSFMGDD